MQASLIWRGCAFAYGAGLGIFATGLAVMLIGAAISVGPTLSDIPVGLVIYTMFMVFAAFYGAIIAVPFVAIAFGLNAILHPMPETIPLWLPSATLATIAVILSRGNGLGIAALAAAAGAIVGYAFWRGIRR
ncbi:MAG: hypothetical protein AAF376_17995 [Pseudomonadota bacterium]